MVEHDVAVFRPGELVAIVLVEADAAGFNCKVVQDVFRERQINYVFNFVLLSLAQVTAKKDLLSSAVGQAPLHETQGALVVPLLRAPHAVGVVLLVAAVAPLRPFRHLEIPSCLRADAIEGLGVGVDCVGNEVEHVPALFESEIAFHLFGDEVGHLVGAVEVVFLGELVEESEGVSSRGIFGLQFLDA